MSKNRNTNKVRKALKRKRQQYHTGSGATHRFAGRMRKWVPHNPATHGGGSFPGGGGGGGGGGQPNPDPDPTPPKTSQPAGEGQGTLTDTSGPKEAPRQEVELGETFTPQKADVEKLDVGGPDEDREMTTDEMRNSGLTPEQDIQQLADYTPVTAPTLPGYQATAAQGKVNRAVTPEDYIAAGFTATQARNLPTTRGAVGTVSDVAEAEGPTLTEKSQAAQRNRRQERQAMGLDAARLQEDERSQIGRVTGETAVVDATREAVAQTRNMVATGTAPEGEAAQIQMMYTAQDQQRSVEAKKNLEKEFRDKGIDSETASKLAEDPAALARQLDSMEDDTIKTPLSGLSREALISTQMEQLLEGMEEGKTPAWARPALAAVEANLAKRGLDVSTVGRDSLFNAIIQSAIPLAQQNAQAIQAATSQDKTIAGQFLIKNAEFKQQMELANLSNEQQMRLANLTALNQADRDNLNASQQTELNNLQARLQTNLKQAEIAASMNQAQLTVDQQTAVTNAMTVAKIDMANMSAEQQVIMANSKFMQTATLTDFNARQQSAVQNATLMANMDLATADQQTKLAITNASNFLKMDIANLSNDQQARILDQQLRQQRMLTNMAADNAAKQFNAASENQKNQFMTNLAGQMEQFNAQQANAMEQFNASEANRIEALNAGNAIQVQKANAAFIAQADQFNKQLESAREQWNAANAQAVEQSNIEWRRKANTIDTAAQNAANQLNAQQAFQISASEQAVIWQLLRDEAAYQRTAYENDQQRQTSLYATALSNETSAGKESGTNVNSLIALIKGIIGGS